MIYPALIFWFVPKPQGFYYSYPFESTGWIPRVLALFGRQKLK